MYSVVLLAAMVSAPETPEGLFHKNSGCCGQTASCGCCGAQAAGCCGQVASCGCSGQSSGRKHRHSGGGCCGQTACGCCGVQSCAPAPACGCCGGGMMMTPAPAPAGKPAEVVPPPKAMANPNAATIVVTGAQDAKVTIGGLVSAGNGETRTLVSPSLDAGQVYHYDLTAEVVRNGQTVKIAEAVTVRPGETTQVNLDFAAGAVVLK